MIPRYTAPEMAALFSDEHRYATWVRIEVLATEAQVRLGRVPEQALDDIRRAPAPSAERVAELELDRQHEALSFLAAFCQEIPEESARWVHLGMTTYDLVDTALGHTLATATDLLLSSTRTLCRVLAQRASEHWETLCIGRTHGVHAEPTSFGHRLAGYAFAIERSVRRLVEAREAVAVGTISGAVGTYSLIDPFVEQYVCDRLGLGIEPAPSQVVARDRHAQLLAAVATLGACIEQIAVEMRLLQRTESREVEEPRAGGYQGSSAMPHKRNPTMSERLCGLSRLLRSYVATGLENVTLWDERDLAHQAVERVVLPDSLSVAQFQVETATRLISGLEVHPDRMRAAVDQTRGLTFSSAVLTQLLEQGVEREKAYRMIQGAANRSVTTGEDFRTALSEAGIDVGPIEPERYLVNHDVVHQRLELLHVLED